MRRTKMLMIAALLTAAGAAPGLAGDTTFTYQGSLKDGGSPASGGYSMAFRLYSAATGGSPLATYSAGSVQVNDGVFSADVDFGSFYFNGADRWIEVVIGGTTLSPRQPITRSPYAIQTRGLFVTDEGNVGIGSTTATELLTLKADDANLLMLSQGNDLGPRLKFRNTESGLSTGHGTIAFEDSAVTLASIGYIKSTSIADGLQFSNQLGPNMKITDTGLVGIGGEQNPLAQLHVLTEDWSLDPSALLNESVVVESSDAVLGLYSDPGGSRGSALVLGEFNAGILVDKWALVRNTSQVGSAITFRYGSSANYAANSTMMAIDSDGDAYFTGRLGVGTSNPQTTLHVDGNARVDVLEVMGADLAERFPTACGGVFEPGTVLEIDPENPGGLRVASGEYSRLVAGVVSGAGGLPAGTIMGNMPGSEDHTPIALSGRVWVLCDAGGAAIEAGDLLTTSGTPGHAMRASDYGRAQGAVIGKAMTGLERGQTGLVLVLVGLQ